MLRERQAAAQARVRWHTPFADRADTRLRFREFRRFRIAVALADLRNLVQRCRRSAARLNFPTLRRGLRRPGLKSSRSASHFSGAQGRPAFLEVLSVVTVT